MPLYEIDNFSKGVTDAYLDGDPTTAKKIDNLLIDEHRELRQRPALAQFGDIIKQLPAGNQRVDGHYYFDSTLFVKSGTRLYYWEDGDTAWTTLDGSNAHAFADSAVGSAVSWSEWRGHLFITPGPTSTKKAGCRTVKVYRNTSDTWVLVQAGLPGIEDAITSGLAPTWSTSVGSGSSEWATHTWYVCFVNEYTALVDGNEVTFKDYGKPFLFYEGSGDPIDSVDTVDFSDDIAYTNTASENYPTSTMAFELYRTENNRTVPRFVASFDIPRTSSFSDNVADADLGAPLYIGDIDTPVLDNDPVPKSFFSEMIDGRMGYFGTEDTDSAEFNYDTYRESKPDDPDSVPAGNYVRVEGKATGLAHVGVYPLCFTFDKSHRIEGHFDLFGGGGLRSRVISHTEGCVSHKGIVRLKDSVYFPSRNGFCWTDGFNVVNLTETHLRQRYADLLNKTNIAGAYHAKERRIYWAVESPDNSPSGVNNELWILDLKWSTPDRASFTTASMTDDNLRANSLYYDSVSQQLLVGDQRGYVLGFDPDSTADVIVETTGDVDTFAHQAIIPHYISSAIRGPSTKFSIWMSMLYCIFKNVTGALYAAFEGYDDDKSTAYSMRGVRQTGVTGVHKVERWWRRSNIESVYKQIGITKGEVNIIWSDVDGPATFEANSATLDAGNWPTYEGYDLVGYTIYFAKDAVDYARTITAQSGAALTFDGAALTGDGVTTNWEIKGIPKGSSMHIECVKAEYEVVGETYVSHRESDDGGNA